VLKIPAFAKRQNVTANAKRQRHRNRKGIEKEKIKPTAQVAHLILPDTQAKRFAKPKEPLFCQPTDRKPT